MMRKEKRKIRNGLVFFVLVMILLLALWLLGGYSAQAAKLHIVPAPLLNGLTGLAGGLIGR